jgi:hypothetical protein
MLKRRWRSSAHTARRANTASGRVHFRKRQCFASLVKVDFLLQNSSISRHSGSPNLFGDVDLVYGSRCNTHRLLRQTANRRSQLVSERTVRAIRARSPGGCHARRFCFQVFQDAKERSHVVLTNSAAEFSNYSWPPHASGGRKIHTTRDLACRFVASSASWRRHYGIDDWTADG